MFQRRKQYPPPGLIGGALKSSVSQITDVGVGITTRLRPPPESPPTRLPRMFQRKSKAIGKLSAGLGGGSAYTSRDDEGDEPHVPSRFRSYDPQESPRKPTQYARQPSYQAQSPQKYARQPAATSVPRRAVIGATGRQDSNQAMNLVRTDSEIRMNIAPEIFVNDEPIDLFKRKSKAVGKMAAQPLFPRQPQAPVQRRGAYEQDDRFRRKAKAVGFMAAQPLFSKEEVVAPRAYNTRFQRKAKSIGFMAAQPLFSREGPVEVQEMSSRFRRKAKSIGFMAAQPLFSKDQGGGPGQNVQNLFRRKAKSIGFMAAQPLFDRLIEGDVYADEEEDSGIEGAPSLVSRFRRKAKAAGFMAAQSLFQKALSVEEAPGVGRFKKTARAILRTQRMCRQNPDAIPELVLEEEEIMDPTRGSNDDEIASGMHPMLRRDVLLHFFSYLTVEDLKTARTVCEFWKRFATISLQKKSVVKLSGICTICKSEFMDYALEPRHEHIDTIPFYRFCKFINDIPPEYHYHLPFRNFRLSDINLYFNVQVTTDATGVFLLFLKYWGDKTHELHLENIQMCPPDSFYRILDTLTRLQSATFENTRIWLDPLAPEPTPESDTTTTFKMHLNMYLKSITFITDFVCEELLHWQMILQAFPKLEELNLIDVTKTEINHCLAALLNLPDEDELADIKKVGGFKKLTRKIMLLPQRRREDELPADEENKTFKQITRLLVRMPFNLARAARLNALAEQQRQKQEEKPGSRWREKLAKILENRRVGLSTKPKIVKIPKSRFQSVTTLTQAVQAFQAPHPYKISMRTIEPEADPAEFGLVIEDTDAPPEIPDRESSIGRDTRSKSRSKSPSPVPGLEPGPVSTPPRPLTPVPTPPPPAPPEPEPEEDDNVAYIQFKGSKFKAAGIVAFKPFSLFDVARQAKVKKSVFDDLDDEDVQELERIVKEEDEKTKVEKTPEEKKQHEMTELARKFYGIKLKARLRARVKERAEKYGEEQVEKAVEEPAVVRVRETTPVADVGSPRARSEERGSAPGTPKKKKEKTPPREEEISMAKRYFALKLQAKFRAKREALQGDAPEGQVPTEVPVPPPVLVVAKQDIKSRLRARLAALGRGEFIIPGLEPDVEKAAALVPRDLKAEFIQYAKQARMAPFGLDLRKPKEERDKERELKKAAKAELKRKMRKKLRAIVNHPFTIIGLNNTVETFKPKTFRAEVQKLIMQPFRLTKPRMIETFRRVAKSMVNQPFNLTEPKKVEFVLPGSRLKRLNISCRRNYDDQLKIELEAIIQAHEDPLDQNNNDDDDDDEDEDDSEKALSLHSVPRSGSSTSSSDSEPSSIQERDFAQLELSELVAEVLTRYDITHLCLRVNYTSEDAENFPMVLEACNPKVTHLALTRPSQIFVPEMDMHIRFNPFETIEETTLVLPNVTSLMIAHNIVDTMDQVTTTFPSLTTLCINVVTTEVCARKAVPYKTYVKTDLMITMRSAKPHVRVKNLTWNVQDARNPETHLRTVVYKSNAIRYIPRVFPSLSKLVVSITTAEELHAIFRGCLTLHDLIVLKNSFYRTKDYDIIGDQESEFVQIRIANNRNTSPTNEHRHDGIRQLKFLRRLSLENNNCLLTNQSIQYGFIHLRRLRSLHISRGKKVDNQLMFLNAATKAFSEDKHRKKTHICFLSIEITQRALREMKICRFLVHVSVTKDKLKASDLRRPKVKKTEAMIQGRVRRKPGPGIMITQAPPVLSAMEKFENSQKYEHFGGKKFAIVKTTYEVNGRRYELVRREYENEGDRDSKVWRSRYRLAALREQELEEQRLQEAAGAELDIDPEKIIRRAEKQYEEDLLNEESDYERFINDYDEEGEFDGYCDEDVELQLEDEEAELKALLEESSGEDGNCQEADTMYEADKEYYLDTPEERTSETESYCDSGTSANNADKETDNLSDDNNGGNSGDNPPNDNPPPNPPGDPPKSNSESSPGDVDDSQPGSDSSGGSKPGQSPKKARKDERDRKSKKQDSEDVENDGDHEERVQKETNEHQQLAVLKLTTLYIIGQEDGHAIEFNRRILDEPEVVDDGRPGSSYIAEFGCSHHDGRTKKTKAVQVKGPKEKKEKRSKTKKESKSKPLESKSPDVLLQRELDKIKDRLKKQTQGKEKEKRDKRRAKDTKDAQTSPMPQLGSSTLGTSISTPPEPSKITGTSTTTLTTPTTPEKVQLLAVPSVSRPKARNTIRSNQPQPVTFPQQKVIPAVVTDDTHATSPTKKMLLEPGRAHSPSHDAKLREERQALIHKMAKQVKRELHRKHSK